MTAAAATAARVRLTDQPGPAVTRLAIRQVRRSAVSVVLLTVGMSALVATTYRSTLGSAEQAASLTALAGNPAIRTLFGEPAALGNAGGFTVWRTGTFIAVLLAAWGLLATTRLTRGEEDTGRWDLLLAGRLTLPQVIGRQLGVLVAAMVVAGLTMSMALILTGTPVSGAALHGSGTALLGVYFIGVAGLMAQIFPARASATGAAAAVLATMLTLRMIGDGVDALGWVRWLTPFGLVELSRPYDTNRWLPLLVLGVAAVTVFAACAAATGRDLRGGWLAPRTGRAPRMTLLGSPLQFAVRRLLRPLAGWFAGVAAYFLLIGLIAASMIGFLAENPRFADLAAQAGFAGLNTVEGYVGTLFALLAMPTGGLAAARVAAFHADESGRRLTSLYAGPVTRRALCGAELTATAGGLLALTIVAGGAAWAGATLSGAGLSIGDALAGAVNVLPLALLSLGAAVLALGVLPGAIGWIGALPTVGGFLLLVIADSVGASDRVSDLSPFAHLALVPAEAPHWPGIVLMLTVAALLCAVGLGAYAQRDQRT